MKLFAIAAACVALTMSYRPARAGSCGSESPVLQRLEVESILEDVALVHSLDPTLLSAIARVESGECTDAVSPKGAVGLMQLMPATASTFGVEDRFDPVQNALGAARFIDYLKRERPEGKLTLPEILAAYNAGEGAVTRAGGIPHFRETEDYVRRVLWLYLIGHVPESERAREGLEKPTPALHAVKLKTSHRFAAGSDSEIFGQLAEVRRARRQSDATAAGQ
jgi:soluble lytic murein transglycosylase-like protein